MIPVRSFRFEMRRVFRARRHLALVVSIACVVGGCIPDPPFSPRPIETGQSAIRFDHADFDPDLAEYALESEPRTGNEWHLAKFFGPDSFAFPAALKTGPGYVVEERTVESNVRVLVNDAQLDWGKSGRVPSRLGYVRYRMFRFTDQPFSCVGFSQPVGQTSDDRGRKSDLAVGYFCYDERRPMSAATAADLIGKVSLSR